MGPLRVETRVPDRNRQVILRSSPSLLCYMIAGVYIRGVAKTAELPSQLMDSWERENLLSFTFLLNYYLYLNSIFSTWPVLIVNSARSATWIPAQSCACSLLSDSKSKKSRSPFQLISIKSITFTLSTYLILSFLMRFYLSAEINMCKTQFTYSLL